MPDQHLDINEKKVPCIACGKPIARGFITAGRISIPCPKCGVINLIQAENKPEGRRVKEREIQLDQPVSSTRG